MARRSWEVKVKKPNANKRERCWAFVRYPPTGAIDEQGEKLRSHRWSSGLEDYAQASQEAERIEKRLNAGSGTIAVGDVQSLVDAYLAASLLSESYEENCRSALKAAPTLAKRSLTSVSRETLLLGRDEMRSGRMNSTVNGYMKTLRAAWSWAEDRGMVPGTWPKVQKLAEGTQKRPYEPDEVAGVLDWLSGYRGGFVDWHAFHTLQADTGVRPGELVRLKGRDLDRMQNRIYISRNKSGRRGAKRRQEWIRVPEATMKLLPECEPGQWLWPSRGVQARGHVTVNGALGALKRALKACGLAWRGKLDQYSFRRWWIDSADAELVPLGDAMKQAGHRKAATHLGYRINSKRSVPPATVEKVRRRRLSGRNVALHGDAGQPRSQAPTAAYEASSDCSREIHQG